MNLKEKARLKRYEGRVLKGIAWLDKSKPGWMKKVDIFELKLQGTGVCVLGQVFGDFWSKVIEYEDDVKEEGKLTQKQAYDMAFLDNYEDKHGEDHGNNDYDLLTKVWFYQLMRVNGCKKLI